MHPKIIFFILVWTTPFSVQSANVNPNILAPGTPYQETVPGSGYVFEMLPVPVGSIEMDDPATPGAKKSVEIKPVWICKTETTWDMYDPYLAASVVEGKERKGMTDVDGVSGPTKPYVPPDLGFGHSNYAVILVSHHAATEYCRWLGAKTGHNYRLPTEAEWEYICKAGNGACPTLDETTLDPIGWFKKNSERKTHPVASKLPNAWGVHDMFGNVLELCDGLDGKPVGRGGSFKSKLEDVGACVRIPETPAWNNTDPQIPKSIWWLSDGPFIGFRIVCDGEWKASWDDSAWGDF
jgi:formylglycine-generating enzyme required for sulfatase activity